MAGQLQKLKVKNEDTREEFSVLFNPSEYSIDAAAKWSEQEKRGQKPEFRDFYLAAQAEYRILLTQECLHCY